MFIDDPSKGVVRSDEPRTPVLAAESNPRPRRSRYMTLETIVQLSHDPIVRLPALPARQSRPSLPETTRAPALRHRRGGKGDCSARNRVARSARCRQPTICPTCLRPPKPSALPPAFFYGRAAVAPRRLLVFCRY